MSIATYPHWNTSNFLSNTNEKCRETQCKDNIENIFNFSNFMLLSLQALRSLGGTPC